MNNDLISREAVKKAFKESENYHSLKLPNDVIIDSVPSVEVGYLTNCANCERVEKIRAKRPQGEWIKDNEGKTICSNCGFECLYSEDGMLYSLGRYCHHCGADMRGKKNE